MNFPQKAEPGGPPISGGLGRRQFVSFRVGRHLLGLDISQVREINRALEITPVQQAPEHVRGLVNLRGQVVVIFDLGILLGLGPRQITEQTHNVLVKGDDVALMVDRIADVVEAEDADVAAPPANMDTIAVNYVRSVVKLRGDLLVVLDVEKILGDRPPTGAAPSGV